jgi:integrase
MFDTLFRYDAVIRRHREGPLAAERAAYLAHLAARGSPMGTLLHRARYCLAIAHVLESLPPGQALTDAEILALARSWAGGRVEGGRALTARWPQENFRTAATEFLKVLGRWMPARPARPRFYPSEVDGFVATQRERLLSPVTCQNRRWHVERLLDYLHQRDCELGATTPEDVDAYFRHAAVRWSRVSLRSAAFALRAWFGHCEAKAWTRPGLAAAILVPRVYRDEGLPLGPTWDQVARLLTLVGGDTPLHLRNTAILRLLAIYGLRSGEVRRLAVQDVDWQRGRLRITRSKSGRHETYPLEASVAHAVDRYLHDARPPSSHPTLFLTIRAPFRPLSAGALHHLVQRGLLPDQPRKGRGPHGLRHACARHLIDAGLSFKEVGDHLGHQSPDSTRVYAKVDLAALRLVAIEDLGGLA